VKKKHRSQQQFSRSTPHRNPTGEGQALTTEEHGVNVFSNNAGSYHVPVMLKECCDALVTKPDGVYIDGTLGGGGHTAEILSRLNDHGEVYSFDADIHAIEACRIRFADILQKTPSPLNLIHDSYTRACSIKKDGKPLSSVSGILLDLGVSSRQLDTDGIGLSYRVNSHLDMRFGSREVPTAARLIATAEQGELEKILREYGEEPFAKSIARRILEIRRLSPVSTTFELRAVVEECVPPHLRVQSLSRVFQAFRIAVNGELEVLEQTLRGIVPLVEQGGRIVVLSYHSLEDRIVKTVFHELSRRSVPIQPNEISEASIKSNMKPIQPMLHVLTKKPLLPTDEEVFHNYRARSAKLRIAEKV
jgi:16S rRNA (cytosine1402-N4)-methyltransferase